MQIVVGFNAEFNRERWSAKCKYVATRMSTCYLITIASVWQKIFQVNLMHIFAIRCGISTNEAFLQEVVVACQVFIRNELIVVDIYSTVINKSGRDGRTSPPRDEHLCVFIRTVSQMNTVRLLICI